MDALALMSERMARMATNARAGANNLSEIDIASQDLCLDILRDLEKHHWMLRAQQP
jgi:DNA-binding ferritin-like protein